MSFESSYNLELFNAQSGFLSAKLIHKSNGRVVHMHSLVKPEDEAGYFNSLKIWGEKIIFLGTGLGYHFKNMIPECKSDILLVDYYQECIDYCKSQIVQNFEGSVTTVSAMNKDLQTIIKKFQQDGKCVQIIKHPVAYNVNKDFYDDILDLLCTQSNQVQRVGKVLILYGSFFLQEEIKNAVVQCNLHPVLFNLNEINGILDFESALQRILQKEKPDLVISVNMLGFDSSGILIDMTFRHGIPVAVWFVDDPRPILLYHKHLIKNNVIAFCWEKTYLPYLRNVGISRSTYLPLATDPNLFNQSIPVIKKQVSLGFVGSSMGRSFLNSVASKFIWHNELDPMVQFIASKIVKTPACDIIREVHQLCKELGFVYPYKDEKNETWFQSYIIHYASMLKRRACINQLIPEGIELFGDPDGWRNLCGNESICHGDIDYRHELASIYRGIAININSTSCQMITAVNQRVFDIPACGGFVISDNQSDLNELFSSDEIVTYETMEELLEKVTYYKQHPDESHGISQKAFNRVINEHTYAHRLSVILGHV
jgi:spore maturation protein CgeB